MRNLITSEVKKVAYEKAFRMPIGTFSRLKVNNKISDIVISPSSSGVYFYNETGTFGKDTLSKIICFISYKDLKQ